MSDLTGDSKATPKQDLQPGAAYKKGDFIDQKYEVHGVLGMGGFGVVYLVYSHQTHEVYALKTFLDKYLADEGVRKRFHKEASVWVELGRHPYLVRAYFVDEVSGRLYIGMEYIAPNEEKLNSLDSYLRQRPPDLAQSLRWAIQICHGMEYAYSKGVRAHRDLKPANIMIAHDMTAKITDFGLAAVVSQFPTMDAVGRSDQSERPDLSGRTGPETVFGTPTHMAPEQFDNATGCDERSDIYSFGVVLYQMATGGRLPFPIPLGADWQVMRQLHRESPVPQLDSPLFPVIERCLEKSPEKRYRTFNELRANLEPLLQHQTGEVIIPPQLKELDAWEWNNKGFSLHSLGRFEDAIRCFDKALELDPGYAAAWNNKGNSLNAVACCKDAIHCCDKALELDPCDAMAWNNKGMALDSLGRFDDAIDCFDKALKLDPDFANAWNNKGITLNDLGRYEDAIHCYDEALKLAPGYAAVWSNKGASLDRLHRYEDAIDYFDRALKLDVDFAKAWNNKGITLNNLGRYGDAIRYYDEALKLDPGFAAVWYNKALSEDGLGWQKEAEHSYQQFLSLALSQQYAKQIEYARQRLRELGGK